MFQKILRFTTFQTPKTEKNADFEVSEDFKIFNFLDPHPPYGKMQIWMFQKISIFSNFQTLQIDKKADLNVSEDFKISNFSDPLPQNKKMQIWMFKQVSRFSTFVIPNPPMRQMQI